MNPHETRLDSALSDLRKLTADIPGAEPAITRLVLATSRYAAQASKEILAEEIASLKSIIGLQKSILETWKRM